MRQELWLAFHLATTIMSRLLNFLRNVLDSHMQALLDISSPTNQLTSLQLFYDTMENHVRGLKSLGRSHETYGDLLVPIILGKLTHELRRNLAREHDNPEWKF